MGTGIRTSNEDANDNIQGMNVITGVDTTQTVKGNRGLFVTAMHKNVAGTPTLKPGFTITNIDGTTCNIVLPVPSPQSAVKTVYLPLQVKTVSNFTNSGWGDINAIPNDFNYYVSILK